MSITKIDASKLISGVDLFCGVGGLTHGLVRGGIKVNAGIDTDSNCRFPYEANNEAIFLEKDVREISANELLPYFDEGSLRLLAGCAPCQPFSTYSRKWRAKGDDDKWDLLMDFGRLVQELQPELVTMENVPQLVDHSVFQKFKLSLSGYHLWYDVVECAKYGVPQTRKRFVLLASKLGPIKLIGPTHHSQNLNTVRKSISNLRPIGAGECDPLDSIHVASALSETNHRRIVVSKPGGTWRDWPAALRAKCHRKVSGETYPSVYGRMEWDRPAPTMTTQCFGYGNGRFGHPEQNRAISLREAALLQTFPKSYRFLDSGGRARFNVLGRLIGNAVPVRLGEVVAKSLQRHVQKLRHSASQA
jgi:DNA (cytosine-5)-methyltransferase 1